MSKRILHCWTSKREWASATFGPYSDEYFDTYEECGGSGDSVCMLPDGHEGPHEWTATSDIAVTFKAASPAK